MELQDFSTASFATTVSSYLLILPLYAQSCITCCAASALLATWGSNPIWCHFLCCPIPPSLRYFRRNEKSFGDCCHFVPPSPAPFPCLFLQQCFVGAAVWGECTKSSRWSPWLTGHRFLAEGLLSDDDICHGWGICEIQVCLSSSSMMLFASYLCLHSHMHSKDKLIWPSRVERVKLKWSMYRKGQVRFEICVTQRCA